MFDVRIFHKECKSLSNAGYDVHLIVQHTNDEIAGDIHIHSLPKVKSRKERLLKLGNIVLKKAIEINADIYHFHDPELIPIALKLKKLGKKVIYDVHEDVPRQILSKPYLNRFIKPIVSNVFEFYENLSAKKFDAIIAATNFIKNRFKKMNQNTVDVRNFPSLSEFSKLPDWTKRRSEICYIGAISRIRGIKELVKALEYVDTTLHLAGSFEDEKFKMEIMSMEGWSKVKYYGFVNRNKVKKILMNVKLGIIPHLFSPNHKYGLSVKLFEYMAAGIPIINYDFGENKKVINECNCGLCVNTSNPKELAEAIFFLLKNDQIAREYGMNGRLAVEEKYNWEKESTKLLDIYKRVCGG